jgi:uncharacterized protein
MVYLDSNVVIYFVERHPSWYAKVVARFAALRAAGEQLAVSDLNRTECLIFPLRSGDAKAEADFRAFFSDPDIRVLPLTPAVCERAARLRVSLKTRLGDSLHLAAAIEHGCSTFLTNDADLTRCRDILVDALT